MLYHSLVGHTLALVYTCIPTARPCHTHQDSMEAAGVSKRLVESDQHNDTYRSFPHNKPTIELCSYIVIMMCMESIYIVYVPIY